MTGRAGKVVSRAAAGLGLAGAMDLLGGKVRDAVGDQAPGRYRHAWAGLMILSLAWGIASAAIFAGVLWVSHRFSPPVWETALAVAGVALAGPYHAVPRELAALTGTKRQGSRVVLLAALWAVWAAGLAYLRLTQHYGRPDEEQALPAALAWVRPDMEALRVLILSPLWGAWAMMIAVQFRRPDKEASPALAEFGGGCGPMLSAAVMGALLWWSILYFSFLPWHQLTISGAAIVGGIVAGVLAGRRAAGLSAGVLLAANLGAQGAFLAAYLANVAR